MTIARACHVSACAWHGTLGNVRVLNTHLGSVGRFWCSRVFQRGARGGFGVFSFFIRQPKHLAFARRARGYQATRRFSAATPAMPNVLVVFACALLACAACALLQALRGSARRQLRLREGPAEHSRALRSEREPGTAQHTVQEPGTVNRCPPARAKYRARVRRGRELDEEFRARMLALKKRGQAFGGRVIEQPTFAALDLGTTLLEPCSEESEEVKWSFCGSWSSAAWSSAGSEGSSRSCHCALASCAARQNEGAVATSL